VFIAHGVSADFKCEDFTIADDIAKRDGLCTFNGLYWLAGSDAAEEGEASEALFCGLRGQDFNGAAAVVCALQEAFRLQVADVLVDGGEGVETEARCDLFIGRRVAVFLCESGEKVDDFFLSPRDCHSAIVANKKRSANIFPRSGADVLACE